MIEMLFNILVSFVNEFFGFRAFLKTKTRQLKQRLTNCYLGKPGEDVRFMRSQGRGGGGGRGELLLYGDSKSAKTISKNCWLMCLKEHSKCLEE